MAPRTRAMRRHNNTSTHHPSVKAAFDDVRPIFNSNHESTSVDRATDDAQCKEINTPAPQSYALVEGKQILVPQTYDPDTYDPDGRMPWTPEPEPYSPETYTAWGRKHFGEKWYTLRKTMLEERNIHHDPVYRERQRALRIMEHKIEGRPFEPGLRAGQMRDAGWKRLWARLSKDLGIETSSNPASPTPSKDNDNSNTDLSGYDTYSASPEPREPTPLPDDPWERLEIHRKRFHWDEERYQYQRIFLNEAIIDGVRTQREDDPGDTQLRKMREEMESFRYVNSARFSLEQRRFQDHISKKDWTQEQIDAAYDAEAALLEWRQKNPEPGRPADFSEAANLDNKAAWDIWSKKFDAAKIRVYGELPPRGSGLFGFSATHEEEEAMEIWHKNIHTRVSGQQQREARTGVVKGASGTKDAPNPRVLPPRHMKGVLHQSRSGRITKRTPTHAKASPPGRRRRSSQPDTLNELSNNTQTTPLRHNRQRKTYKKERASRRLAGEFPEYGMLPGQAEADPLYTTSSRQSSNTRQASGSSRRSGKLSKKPMAVTSVESQAVLKSAQARTGRPKRLAKG